MTAGPASDQSIARDVDCLACGYNLRGLRPDALCPECGRHVADSLKDRTLAAADPSWRRTLRRGVAVAAVEYVAMMVVVPLVEVVDVEPYTPYLVAAMTVSATLGGWWIGRPEPGARRGGKLRVGLRGAVVGLVGGYVLMLMMDAGWWPEWYMDATRAFLAANAVKSGLQMAVLAGVARRAAGVRLARVARWMTAVAPTVWGLMLLEQFPWDLPWVEWAVVAGVATACLAVVAYHGWFYRVLRGPRVVA